MLQSHVCCCFIVVSVPHSQLVLQGSDQLIKVGGTLGEQGREGGGGRNSRGERGMGAVLGGGGGNGLGWW